MPVTINRLVPIDVTHVDLDWADPEDPYAERFARRNFLAVQTMRESGPGGGWPVLRFYGVQWRIDKLVKDYGL